MQSADSLSMRLPVVLRAVLGASATLITLGGWGASTVASAALPRPACALLTIAEVSRAVGTQVSVDPDQSGPDGGGADNCTWRLAKNRFLVLATRVADSASVVGLTYAFLSAEAFGGRDHKQPEPVDGVGDQAEYRDFEGNVAGGALVARQNAVAFTLSGGVSREALISLGRLVVSRL